MINLLVKAPAHAVPYFSDDVLKYLIPTSVTLFVFTLGLIAQWLKANMERRRQYRQLKNLFINWVPNLQNPVTIYAANCDDFSTRLTASERLSPESMAFIPLNAAKLAGIDINQLVKTFIYNSNGAQKENNQQLYYMVSNLEYLDDLNPEMEAKYQEHYAGTNSLMNDWNAAFIALSDLQVKVFNSQVPKTAARIALDNALRNNVINWTALSQASPQNTVITYNHLLVPNLQLLNNYFQQTHSEEQEVVDFTAALHRAAIIYRQWRAGHEGYATIFTNYGTKLRECYNRIQASINYFENETQINWICS
jgi:hypothetical protein